MNFKLVTILLFTPLLIWGGSKYDKKIRKILLKNFGSDVNISVYEHTLSKEEKKAVEQKSRITIRIPQIAYYKILNSGKLIATGIERTRDSKSGYVTFFTIIDSSTTIHSTHMLKSGNSRSAGLHSKLFRKQFKGKGRSNKIRYEVDIDGVSGATSSSIAAIKIVKSSLYIVDHLNK